MKNDHNYSPATVRFYDATYKVLANKGRYRFYSEEIANTKGAILEAGVGTGMIFVPALESGADIYGIDKSELMYNKILSKLDKKDHKRISLQDIRDFNLDRKFSLVISPFRVFQHLITTEDQLNALERIYTHLEDGGLFIFDLFCPDPARLLNKLHEVFEFEGEYEPGKKLKRYYSIEPDYINQVQNVTFKHVWDEDGKEMSSEYSFPMRYYFRFEIVHMLERAKFKIKNIYGDFERSELNNNSKEFVIVCSK